MKKLLTLLGSIGMVASTAAIVVACENKIPAISLNTDNTTDIKEKVENQSKEKQSKGTESAPQTDQSNVGKLINENKKKQLEEAEQALKEAEKKAKLAKEKYRMALEEAKKHKKDTPLYNQAIDKIDAAQDGVTVAENDLKAAQEKVAELKK
ncbi:lipoprotein [Mycoplasma capricolum subsp. capricolum]|uniref:lipoprotein n=1 Tax=Mycoplasma capricolum TaxID=2095 RepID=UPI003DA32EF9